MLSGWQPSTLSVPTTTLAVAVAVMGGVAPAILMYAPICALGAEKVTTSLLQMCAQAQKTQLRRGGWGAKGVR